MRSLGVKELKMSGKCFTACVLRPLVYDVRVVKWSNALVRLGLMCNRMTLEQDEYCNMYFGACYNLADTNAQEFVLSILADVV